MSTGSNDSVFVVESGTYNFSCTLAAPKLSNP